MIATVGVTYNSNIKLTLVWLIFMCTYSGRSIFNDMFDTGEKKERKSGERWLVYGPTEFVPHIDEHVVCLRCVYEIGTTSAVHLNTRNKL